jgi:hypothetical protein
MNVVALGHKSKRQDETRIGDGTKANCGRESAQIPVVRWGNAFKLGNK